MSWEKQVEDAAMDFGAAPAPKPKVRRKSAEDREDAQEVPGPGSDRYQKSYYRRKRNKLADRARKRWETNDRGYRDRGLARAREKRAHQRAQTANETFEERVANTKQKRGECDVCGRTSAKTETRPCRRKLKKAGKRCKGTMREVDKPVRTKKPRRVEIDGEPVWVYSSGALALLCGRSPATVRTWIEERVLPGYSIQISRRYWYTQEFIEAVAEACRKVLFVDGRSPLYLIRRYVRQELDERGVQYTPLPPKGG